MKKQQTVIIGGGIAGLSLLKELHHRGIDSHLFEASSRLGGRCYTLFDFFDYGLPGELGPLRILSAHKNIIQLVQESGLDLVPNREIRSSSFWLQEKAFYHRTGENLLAKVPYNFADQELAGELGSTHAIALYYYRSLLEKVKKMQPALRFTDANIADMDQFTIAQWLIQQGASPGAVDFFNLGAGFARQGSALFLLRQLLNHDKTNAKYHIKGGMGLLPKALAQGLDAQISLNSQLVAVKRQRENFILTIRHQARETVIQADRLIITVPFSALRSIKLQLALPDELLSAVHELHYASSIRALIQVPEDFSLSCNKSDVIFTHHPMEICEAALSTDDENIPSKLIVVYIKGDYARKLEKHTRQEMRNIIFAELKSVLPGLAQNAEKVWLQPWGAEAFYAGSYPIYAPGQMTRFSEIIMQSHNRLYFAGDHASDCPGWLEGAARSAKRVLQQILLDEHSH
jgi:monoamine oxidase